MKINAELIPLIILTLYTIFFRTKAFYKSVKAYKASGNIKTIYPELLFAFITVIILYFTWAFSIKIK